MSFVNKHCFGEEAVSMIWIDQKYLGQRMGGFSPVYEILPPEHAGDLKGCSMRISVDDVMISQGKISIRPGVWDRLQREMVFEFKLSGDPVPQGEGHRYTEEELLSLYQKEALA